LGDQNDWFSAVPSEVMREFRRLRGYSGDEDAIPGPCSESEEPGDAPAPAPVSGSLQPDDPSALRRRLAEVDLALEDFERKRREHRGSPDSYGAVFFRDRVVSLREEADAIQSKLAEIEYRRNEAAIVNKIDQLIESHNARQLAIFDRMAQLIEHAHPESEVPNEPAAQQPAEPGAPSPEGESKPPLAPANPTEEQDTESRVAEFLRDHPHAKSPEIARNIGKTEQGVRLTPAWKEHRKMLMEQGQKPEVHTKPLSRAMLAAIDSQVRDPAELAAEREEQEMEERSSPGDPAGVKPTEVLKRKYVEGATPAERARFNRLSTADQEHELQAWQWTGKRLAD
jgi:hypothetical protein